MIDSDWSSARIEVEASIDVPDELLEVARARLEWPEGMNFVFMDMDIGERTDE